MISFFKTHRIGQWLASYSTMGCLLLPMCLWIIGMTLLGLAPEVIASAAAFQLFYLLLCCGVASGLVNKVRQRQSAFGSLFAGILLILISGITWYGLSFTGTAELGMGETLSRYQAARGARWGPPPMLPLLVAAAPSQNYGKTAVVVGGSKKEILVNQWVFWRWYRLKVVGESMAPFLLIDERVGDEDYAGFVRLPVGKEEPPYFTFGDLPHRFYLSVPQNAPPVKSCVTPGLLRLKIMRGKLNVLTKDVALGDLVRFEGHSVRFENGAPWVRLEIMDLRPWYLFAVGVMLTAWGLLLSLLHRAKTRQA